jgi:hypothetical protein
VVLRWPSAAGRTYRAESTSNLPSGNWQILTNNLAGSGHELEVLDALATNTNRFYRIEVVRE